MNSMGDKRQMPGRGHNRALEVMVLAESLPQVAVCELLNHTPTRRMEHSNIPLQALASR